MKSKQPFDLLRWVALLLLLASLIAWGVPAYSGDAAGQAGSRLTAEAAAAKAGNDADVPELKRQLKELEDATRQNYMLELDGQRKKVDWWLNFLAVILAVLALLVPIAGFGIPYFMVRKDKDIIERDKAQIKQWRDEAEAQVNLIRERAEESAKLNETMKHYQEGSGASANPKIQQTVEAVKMDKSSDTIMRLRAEAISAGQSKDANTAYSLWQALIVLEPDVATARFNAGYWARQLSDKAQGTEKLHWLRAAGKHYAQALNLKPDMHEAANNWGVALNKEARALAATEPDIARALWKQAGEKYQLALSIKPDKHDTAKNWANVLVAEAGIVEASEPEYSRQLLDQAERLLRSHADVVPGKMAYSLACVYGRRGEVENCLKWLQVAQEHKTLQSCEHMRKDKDLDAVRNAPEFIEWFKQVCP